MKVYTLAEKRTINVGHNGYREEEVITKNGPFGEGFPPVFRMETEAHDFLKNMKFSKRYTVVCLSVV